MLSFLALSGLSISSSSAVHEYTFFLGCVFSWGFTLILTIFNLEVLRLLRLLLSLLR